MFEWVCRACGFVASTPNERDEHRCERLLYGTTARVHVDRLMQQIDEAVQQSFTEIRSGQKLKPKVREQLWRRLAGVQGNLESISLWLQAGARE
jgi:hypothetical protein